MFGLSTQEVEMKNVYAAYQNCLSIYYEATKKTLDKIESNSENEQQILMLSTRKEYFDASKEMLFNYLRTQYRNFDSKFENALTQTSSLFSQEEILEFKRQGFGAGSLFYFIYTTITGKEPKPQNCMILNGKLNELMDGVLGLIEKELSDE